MEKVQPSKYLCWVVHLDGMEDKHDESVARAGVFKKAVDAIQKALDQGYRVCTNTTVFRGSDVEDLTEMFRMVSDIGVGRLHAILRGTTLLTLPIKKSS